MRNWGIGAGSRRCRYPRSACSRASCRRPPAPFRARGVYGLAVFFVNAALSLPTGPLRAPIGNEGAASRRNHLDSLHTQDRFNMAGIGRQRASRQGHQERSQEPGREVSLLDGADRIRLGSLRAAGFPDTFNTVTHLLTWPCGPPGSLILLFCFALRSRPEGPLKNIGKLTEKND